MDIFVGLEKECLMFDQKFNPHYYSLGELNKNMTLDFSDNQLEFISDPFKSTHEIVEQLYGLLNEEKVTNYNMWPMSQSGFIFEDIKYEALGIKAHKYRQKLLEKYSTKTMSLSGIHFNVSFDKEINNPQEYYFNLLKKIYLFSPLIVQFFSYTPVYEKGILDEGLEDIGRNRGFENSISLRNSQKFGYLNEQNYKLDYTNYKTYKRSIEKVVKDGKLEGKQGLYSKVRLKDDKDTYIEIRFIDLNPFYRLGISVDEITLLKKFILYIDKLHIHNVDVNLANKNFDKVVLEGKDKNISINISGVEDSLYNHTISFLDNVSKEVYLNSKEKFILDKFKDKYINNALDLNKFDNLLKEKDLSVKEFGIQNSFTKEKFEPFFEDQSLELSTKILMREAINQGVDCKVVDEDSSTIILNKEGREELVVQATKTNKDKYANILLMENKFLSKYILRQNNINTPIGEEYKDIAEVNYSLFKENKMVIKPIDTNFGVGITILEKGSSKKEVDKALKLAFSFSKKIIVEKFFVGEEFRFLVIDGKVSSIVRRVRANVIGDGKHSILELVNLKNESPLRNTGYITPLEKLKIGNIENETLLEQGYNKDHIPNAGEVIYLRKNSNVSTGGDSEEVSDKISEYFKDIAIKTAKAFDVKICGIDMIIDEKYQDYTIIEVNFNPAIQMHTYPYLGLGKTPAKNLIDLLFEKER